MKKEYYSKYSFFILSKTNIMQIINNYQEIKEII